MRKGLLFTLCLLVLFLSSCRKDQHIEVQLGVVPFIGELISFVAYENGYFSEEGLDVTLRYFPAGKDSIVSLVNGEVDIATSAHTPVVTQVFQESDFHILVSLMMSSTLDGVLARRDSSIETYQDIEGKHIGIYLGTESEFLLDKFIEYYDINENTLILHDLTPDEQVAQLINGDIDVMFGWEPNLYFAEKALGEQALRLSTESLNSMTWIALSNVDFTSNHPKAIEAYLRAMKSAEQFIQSNPQEAAQIGMDYIGLDQELQDLLFQLANYQITLNENILTILESQAAWFILKEKTSQTSIPNFIDYIYFQGIDSVSPETNRIIH